LGLDEDIDYWPPRLKRQVEKRRDFPQIEKTNSYEKPNEIGVRAIWFKKGGL
jgi:hypothetical protein